jgi:hypothetical protein
MNGEWIFLKAIAVILAPYIPIIVTYISSRKKIQIFLFHLVHHWTCSKSSSYSVFFFFSHGAIDAEYFNLHNFWWRYFYGTASVRTLFNRTGFSCALTTLLLWLTARQRTRLIFHRYLAARSRRRIFLTSGSPFSYVTTFLSRFHNFHRTRSVLNNFPHPKTSNQLVVLGHDTATSQEIQVFSVAWKIIRKNTNFVLSGMITDNRSTLTTVRTNINI